MRFWGCTSLLATIGAVVGYYWMTHGAVPKSSAAFAYIGAFALCSAIAFVAAGLWMRATTAVLLNERAAHVAKYPPAPTPEPSVDDQIALAYQCGVFMGMSFPFD